MIYKTVYDDETKHTHILVVKPADASGRSSVLVATAKGHTHLASSRMPSPTEIQAHTDEQGNVDPTVFYSNISIDPSGKDNHTHLVERVPVEEETEIDLEDEEVDTLARKLKDDITLAKQMRQLHKDAKNKEQWSMDAANEADRFYNGDQWDSQDRAILKSENRACLTINETAAKIDLLSGVQRQNRTDIQILPAADGNALAADIMHALTKMVWSNNLADFTESEIFLNALKVGRDCWFADIEVSSNPKGEIVLGQTGWKNVYFGAHTKSDASDAPYVIYDNWFTKDDIATKYPDKMKELTADLQYWVEAAEVQGYASQPEGTTGSRSSHSEIPQSPQENKTDYLPDAEYVDVSEKNIT